MGDLHILRVRLDPRCVSEGAAELLGLAADRSAECSMMWRNGRPVFAANVHEADVVLAEFSHGNEYLHGMPRLPQQFQERTNQ